MDCMPHHFAHYSHIERPKPPVQVLRIRTSRPNKNDCVEPTYITIVVYNPVVIPAVARPSGYVMTTVMTNPDFTKRRRHIPILSDLPMSQPGVSVSAVPEPATWLSMLIGFFGIGAMIRKGKRHEDSESNPPRCRWPHHWG